MKHFLLFCTIFMFTSVFHSTVKAQITPEIIQKSTQLWLLSKLNKSTSSNETKGAITINQALAKNEFEDSNISNTGVPESEIHAAINPLDTNNIIVASMQFTPSGLSSTLSIPIYYTQDFGQSWNQSSFQAAVSGDPLSLILGGGDPVLVFTPDGKAHLNWLLLTISLLTAETTFSIFHAVSNDGGVNWTQDSTPVDEGNVITNTDNFPEITLSGRGVDKEWSSVDNHPDSPYYGNLYTSYVELEIDEIAHYQLLLKTWNAENGYSEPIIAVDSISFFLSQFATTTVTQSGDVHLFWLGVSYDDFYLGLYHAKSSDGAQHFSQANLVSYINVPCFPPMTSTTACIPGVDADRTISSNYILAGNTTATSDYLYVVWSANGFQEEETPGFDIYFARSIDAGATWSLPKIINTDNNPSVNNFMPYMNLSPNGQLNIVWYDQRALEDGSVTDYYGVTSSDGGETFSDEFKISCIPSDFGTIGNLNDNFGVGEYNATVSTDHYIIPFWADGRTNDGNLEIYFAKIGIDALIPTSIQTLTLENATDLIIHPNPASDFIQLEMIVSAPLSIVKGHILNMSGDIISTVSIPQKLSTGTHQVKIDISKLPVGNYLFFLSTENGNIAKQFSKI